VIVVGTVLHDTYRIERPLGRGAMGSVYRAAHLRVPRPYAIKVLESIGDVDKAFSRFRREAEICSQLGHPNIVEVFDFNRTAEGQAYFVMELLEGHSLAVELQRAAAPLPAARVLEILTPVASALMAAHAAGVIHRDLKPSNIFLARKGPAEVVKVLDFGVSKILGALDLTTQGEVLVGTPAYMSPEQASGETRLIDPRSDQFSLATIAYEMLSGRRAFGDRGETPYVTLHKIVSTEPAPLPTLPAPLWAALETALKKAPDERYQDVATFVEALAHGVSHPQAAPLRPAPPVSSPALAVAPSPLRWWIGAAAGLLLALVALLVAYQWRQAHAHRPAPTLPPGSALPSSTTAAPLPPPTPPAALTQLSLVATPPQARLVLLGADGMSSIVPGPWTAEAARVLRWLPGRRPLAAHLEADGYEPADVTLPSDGHSDTATIHLTRRKHP
jgi:serine/threonine-protein kinase